MQSFRNGFIIRPLNLDQRVRGRDQHFLRAENGAEEGLSSSVGRNPSLSENISAQGAATLERRRKLRINEPFPAKVWGVDGAGHSFNLDCVLDNLSSKGLYLRMPIEMSSGAEIDIVVQLLSGPGTGATVALEGRVLRKEPQANGHHGIAVAIKKHTFL